MQHISEEIARAREALVEADDPRAGGALEGIILALNWVNENGVTSPVSVAAELRTDPLDHDGDGEKGGSKKGKLATAAKRVKK
jgi:hypothetical protein